jgi:PAP2 superfamily protein
MLSTLVRSGRLSGGVRAGLGAVQRRARQLARGAGWWREIALIALLYVGYEFSRGFGDIDVHAAAKNGREIMHLEQVWHLAPEHVLNEALAHATFFAVLASYFYSLAHYLVTPAVLIWMFRKHRAQYGPARTALAISTAVGLIGYIFLPTAPPRMLADTGLRDTLADTQNWGWWGGEGSVPRGLGALTNQFAAMPSLHVGWAIWCGVLIALYAERRWVKLLGIAYPLTTTVVVMATGNHYLLDAIAGGITMAAGALLTSALPKRSVSVDADAGVDEGAQNGAVASDGMLLSSDPATADDVTGLRHFPRQPVPLAGAARDQFCRPGR